MWSNVRDTPWDDETELPEQPADLIRLAVRARTTP